MTRSATSTRVPQARPDDHDRPRQQRRTAFAISRHVPTCRACPLKIQDAVRNATARRIVRDVNEEARDVARALAKTEAFAQTRRDRKKVEMLFAHLKRILRLGRLDCEARAARSSSSRSRPSPRTCGAWRNWWPGLRRWCPSRALRECRVASVASRLRLGRQFSASVPPLRAEPAEIPGTTALQKGQIASPRPSNRRLLQQNRPIPERSAGNPRSTARPEAGAAP